MWLLLIVALVLLLSGRTINPPGAQQHIFLIANAIAKAEGFFAGDTLPKRRNNPGSLTSGGTLIQFDSEQAGWSALYRQIEIMLSGQSLYYSPEMTISEIAQVYTGGDKPAAWANIVSSELGVTRETRFGDLQELLV